jgi:hypothetical protein
MANFGILIAHLRQVAIGIHPPLSLLESKAVSAQKEDIPPTHQTHLGQRFLEAVEVDVPYRVAEKPVLHVVYQGCCQAFARAAYDKAALPHSLHFTLGS